MSDLRVIRLDVQAETAEDYIHAAAKRFGDEFFVPTDEVFGDRVRIEAPFLGGAVGVRGVALATSAMRDGRKGYVVRMLELDRDSVHVLIPGPLGEESSEAPQMSSPRDTPPWMPALRAPAEPATEPVPIQSAAELSPPPPEPEPPPVLEPPPEPEPEPPPEPEPEQANDTPTEIAEIVAPAAVAPVLVEASVQDARPPRRMVAVGVASVAFVVILVLWFITRRSEHPEPDLTTRGPAPSALDADVRSADAEVRAPPDAVEAPDAPPARPVEQPPVVVHPPPLRAEGSGTSSGSARRPVPPPLPAAPTSISPRDNASITCRSFGTEIELVWAAVPDAVGYTVEVARDASFSSIVATINVEGTTVGIFRPMAPGVFVWRVRTRAANDARSEPGDVRQFTCSAES